MTQRRIKFYLVLFFLTVLSFIIRSHALGLSSFAIDEMISMNFAKHPYFMAIFWDNSPFLYNFILKFWMMAFGDTEVMVRTLSALFSTCSTAILTTLGYFIYGLPGALVLGGLHCVSPLSIVYAQEARPYALFEMACSLNLFFLVKSFKEKRQGALYYSSLVLLCLSHYMGFFVMFFQLLFIFKNKIEFRKYSFEISIILLGLILIGGSLFLRLFHLEFLQWQELKFQEEIHSRWPQELFTYLLFRSNISIFGIICLLLTSFSIKDGAFRKRMNLILSYTLWTVIILETVSFITRRALFIPRYYLFLLPFWTLFLGYVFMTTWQRVSARKPLLLCATLIFFGAFFSVLGLYVPRHSPWRDVALRIRTEPSSLVLTTRSPAISTPYFEWIKTPVEVINPDENIPSQVEEKLNSVENIWIVEPAVPGTTYLEELQKKLKEKNLFTEQFSATVENTEPIYVLRVRKKNL